MAPPDRILGWKAIGAYFGRDRTTVMRWARERELPVHRLPGGKTGSVFAFRSELDAWALSHAPEGEAETAPAPSHPGASRRWLIAGAAAGFVAATGAALWLSRPRPSRALPEDPELSALYVQARDDWAHRTEPSLRRAITALSEVTRRDPTFAPAFVALAEAWLLSREFGSTSDAAAFPAAAEAAAAALRLDPDLPGALRAIGFIEYWWNRRPPEAGRALRRALAIEPENAQTRFWYGNILSDNGRHPQALAELDRARLLEPGSIAIQTDLAWARWNAGDDPGAERGLRSVIEARDDFATAHECLAIVRLAAGDAAGYVREYERYAVLRGDPALAAEARDGSDALADGDAAFRTWLLRTALRNAKAPRGLLAWPAFVAALDPDPEPLLAILRRADQRNERWGSSGRSLRIRRRWRSHPEVIRLLDRRAPAPVL